MAVRSWKIVPKIIITSSHTTGGTYAVASRRTSRIAFARMMMWSHFKQLSAVEGSCWISKISASSCLKEWTFSEMVLSVNRKTPWNRQIKQHNTGRSRSASDLWSVSSRLEKALAPHSHHQDLPSSEGFWPWRIWDQASCSKSVLAGLSSFEQKPTNVQSLPNQIHNRSVECPRRSEACHSLALDLKQVHRSMRFTQFHRHDILLNLYLPPWSIR